MIRLFLLFAYFISVPLFSQQVSGIITDEDQNPLSAVLVFNLTTEQKTYTNQNGEFSIAADVNDELRFVKKGFERNSKMVSNLDFYAPLRIVIIRTIQIIEEVQVPLIRLTGDLNQDARNLTKVDKVAQLQAEIGVPAPPEKPREKPAEFKKDVLLPLIFLSMKPEVVYDLISGDARRMKAQYRYEDLQDNISWIRAKVDDDYFTKMEIPPEKISEFLQFSIGTKPEISKYIKARNLSKVLFIIEDTLPIYLKNRNVK